MAANFAELITKAFNGPPIAGVGATADAGLQTDRYHVIPYSVQQKREVEWKEEAGGNSGAWLLGAGWGDISAREVYRYAVWNVEHRFNFDQTTSDLAAQDPTAREALRKDLICTVALMIGSNLYAGECRAPSADEKTTIDGVAIKDEDFSAYTSMESISRAATIIMARAHTKYQTNHAIGGNPPQGSVAAVMRAFYSMSVISAENVALRQKVKAIADAIYWCTHPVNEAVLIPVLIANSRLNKCRIPSAGPEPIIPRVDEFFVIRKDTPPASTHNFALALQGAKMLKAFGVLDYLPEPARLDMAMNGLSLVRLYGAATHPAANYWGLQRITADQKGIETLVQDIGYAVTRLLPASSLSRAPAFQRQDAVSSNWKNLIDALKNYLDENAAKLAPAEVIESLKKQLLPGAGRSDAFQRFLTWGGPGGGSDGGDDSGDGPSGGAGTGGAPSGDGAGASKIVIGGKEFEDGDDSNFKGDTKIADAAVVDVEDLMDFEATDKDDYTMSEAKGDGKWELVDRLAYPLSGEASEVSAAKVCADKVKVEGRRIDDEQAITCPRFALSDPFAYPCNGYTRHYTYEDSDITKTSTKGHTRTLQNGVILRVDRAGWVIDKLGNVYIHKAVIAGPGRA